MKINGEQLKQTIAILSRSYTKDEVIRMFETQLTTEQLGEIVRQMLNDVKYNNRIPSESLSHYRDRISQCK